MAQRGRVSFKYNNDRRNYSRNGRYRSQSAGRNNSQNRGINDVLNLILNRLEKLEQPRDTSRPNRKPEVNRPVGQANGNRDNRTQNRQKNVRVNTGTVNQSRNNNYFESENPDFSHLVKGAFAVGQTDHHLRNWQRCPPSIAGQIDKIIGNIKPPKADGELKQTLKKAADAFKSSIQKAVHQHLEFVQATAYDNLADLDQRDRNEAEKVADRQLRRRLGSRFKNSSNTAGGGDWQTVKTSRRQPPTRNTAPLPVPVSNRFDGLDDGEGPMVTTDDLDIVEAVVNTNRQPNSRKRPRSMASANEPDAHSDTDERAPPPPPPTASPTLRSAVKTVHNRERINWRLDRLNQVRHLVVTDSNGRRWDESVMPPGTSIQVFPGCRLEDALNLLPATANRKQITDIVLAVGINDRQSDLAMSSCFMRDIASWATVNSKKVTFTAIPIIMGMSPSTAENIRRMNDAAAEIFSSFLDPFGKDPLEAGDATGVHYTETAALQIATSVADSYNFL